MTDVRKILINGNNYQSDYIGELSNFICRLAASDKVDLKVTPMFASYLREAIPHLNYVIEEPSDSFVPQLVVSIGGDGTFLSTASMVGDSQIPIMGINSGHLGYLAAARIGEVDTLVKAIIDGAYIVSPRSLVEVKLSDTDIFFALNEVGFMKRDTASMIIIKTTVCVPPTAENQGYSMELAHYLGDGLLVSTPTGSTGYNLSVGGPIVAPSARNFILSPIAAHSLTMRPLVLPDNVEFDISVQSRTGQFLLSVDGHSRVYPGGTVFHLRKAPYVVNLVHLPDHNFIETLRTKLLWGADGR